MTNLIVSRFLRIDKGLGDASVVINTPSILEYSIFKGTLEDAIKIVKIMISNKSPEFFRWEYQKEFINDWKSMN